MDKMENGKAAEVSVKTAQPTKDFQYHVVTFLMILLFYFCGLVTVTSSKILMVSYPFPLILCTLQFGMASLLTIVYLRFTNNRQHGYPTVRITRLVALTGAVYAIGFVFLNASMQWSDASFVETLRAVEPLTTLILGGIFLQERSSTMTMSTLLPICGGVMLSCSNSADFSMTGCITVLLSNLSFSGRSVFVRLIHQIDMHCMEPFNFFADLSMYGFLILLPITLVVEGRSAYTAFVTPTTAMLDTTGGILQLLPIVLLNIIMYTIYTVTSFSILQRTDLIIHAVVNGFRRVFSIILTALYFGVLLNTANLTGVLIAVAGVLLFAYFKAKETSHK